MIDTLVGADDATIEVLETVLEESHDFDEERQKTMPDTFKQVVTSSIIIFSSTLSPTKLTTTEFVNDIMFYVFIVVVVYFAKTSAILQSDAFYDKVGHYIHEFTVDMLDIVYRFYICIIIALFRNYMSYTIDEVHFVIVALMFYNMCSKIWIRHTQKKKFVFKVSSRNPPRPRRRGQRAHHSDNDVDFDVDLTGN